MSKPRGTPKKRISAKEKEFAEYMISEEVGPIQAARKVFDWKCEPGSLQSRRAMNIAKSPRVKAFKDKLKKQVDKEVEATRIFTDVSTIQWDQIRKFAYDRLLEIRDDDSKGFNTRLNAIKALERLVDPSADVNLINMWLDLLWRGANAHCPSCHKTFPLYNVKNDKLDEWRKEVGADPTKIVESVLEHRKEILVRADARKEPHPGQIVALEAPERHVVGLGAARSGKSYLLSMMALLTFLIPGVEIWILARVYKDAVSEVEYIRKFLNTLFFPYTKHIVKETYDSKTEELTLASKWGSMLKVKSAKAKGSITGRELEMALVAEPGWVPDDIFEEIRARMSSRLGRIIMLGTPKGFGGLLGRMINAIGRDPETGNIFRMTPAQRTLEAGCPWNISMKVYNMKPEDNPEYVKSELKAARMELLDSEYASEFQGLMSSAEGSKFPQIKEGHLYAPPRSFYEEATWVLGVDQGPKNFAACLLAYNGERIVAAREYFESDSRTLKYHIMRLRSAVPLWIKQAGGDPGMWPITIFDAAPLINGELEEMEIENTPWPTDITWRPTNAGGKFAQENWRRETYEHVNVLAMNDNLIFDINYCDMLHDQLIRAQDKPEDRTKDLTKRSDKGWIINDPFRGDHVCDAFVLGIHVILSGQVMIPDAKPEPKGVWEEAQAAFNYKIALDEKRELSGYSGKPTRSNDVFEEHFGRQRSNGLLVGIRGYYKDES